MAGAGRPPCLTRPTPGPGWFPYKSRPAARDVHVSFKVSSASRTVPGAGLAVAAGEKAARETPFGDVLDQLERSGLIGAVSMLRTGPATSITSI